MAEAKKPSALETARFFRKRKARADFKAFDKIMRRRGGKPPRAGDETPGSGWARIYLQLVVRIRAREAKELRPRRAVRGVASAA